MKSWVVQEPSRLLTEAKKQFSGQFTAKDVRWAIEHNRCFVNHHVERFGSKRLKKGDHIAIHIEKRPSLVLEEHRILFADDQIMVYDKPPYITSEELAKLSHCHLVHRLDQGTSGVIVLAKTEESKQQLEDQFRKRSIDKEYLALVEGQTPESGTITGHMAVVRRYEGGVIWGLSHKGLWSQTQWKCLSQEKKRSLLLCMPLTGRTHQIRVHLASIGHPIIGDAIYGLRQQSAAFRPLLHALRLTFAHPLTHKTLSFSAPLPPDFPEVKESVLS